LAAIIAVYIPKIVAHDATTFQLHGMTTNIEKEEEAEQEKNLLQ
jgi:hypothetical protein